MSRKTIAIIEIAVAVLALAMAIIDYLGSSTVLACMWFALACMSGMMGIRSFKNKDKE